MYFIVFQSDFYRSWRLEGGIGKLEAGREILVLLRYIILDGLSWR